MMKKGLVEGECDGQRLACGVCLASALCSLAVCGLSYVLGVDGLCLCTLPAFINLISETARGLNVLVIELVK